MTVLVWGPCEVELVALTPPVCVRATEREREEVAGSVLDKVRVRDCLDDDETEIDSEGDGVRE